MRPSSSSAEPGTATDRLLAMAPFDRSDAAQAAFVESFRETARAHFDGNPVFRAFWQDARLTPDDITSEEALARVPPLMVHLFKERALCSVRPEELALTLTSSGTGGQKSQQFLSRRSLERVKRLAFTIHEALGLTAPEEEVSYFCFTYDPRVAKDLGTAFTDELLTGFTARRSVYYAFAWQEARRDFVFDEDEAMATLRELGRAGGPVRILGFPAFLHRLLEKGLTLELGPRSFVQTGGGWKALAAGEIPKAEFRRLVSARLGLPEANVRDLFGMVEHGIPYVDCRKGRMHIPAYARVYTRSPDGKRLLAPGERGLLQFLCTYNDSYPAMSLLTTDWGRVGTCDCELGGSVLEVLGRAGVTKGKGCAVKAQDLLA